MREKAMSILQKEAELQEIVRLVGVEALSAEEQLLLNTAKSIREDFLHQNAFDEIDTYTSLQKLYLMLKAILAFYNLGLKKLRENLKLEEILMLPFKEDIVKAKIMTEDKLEKSIKAINETV